MDVCTSAFEFSAPFAHVVRLETFLRILHIVGNKFPPAQCFFNTKKKNESEIVIRTWREKRVTAPSLTAYTACKNALISTAIMSKDWIKTKLSKNVLFNANKHGFHCEN